MLIRRRKQLKTIDSPLKVTIRPYPPSPGWLVIHLEAPEDRVKTGVTTLNKLFKMLGYQDHQSTSALTGHRWYFRWNPQRLAGYIQPLGFKVIVE